MTDRPNLSRRQIVSGAALGAAGALAAPAIATAEGQTTTWKVQTSWPGGIGLEISDLETIPEDPEVGGRPHEATYDWSGPGIAAGLKILF